ncbi:MAG: TIGR00269 family protein [Candidatus Diapherotrites archaeon]
MKCTRCGKKAVVNIKYGPDAYCKKHFLEFFERRVRRTVRMNSLVRKGEKVAVAYSGGKDSGTTLFLLNKILKNRNQVVAVMVDEGIQGYRDSALKIAKKNCKKWGVEFAEAKFADEYGFTMVDVAKKTTAKKVLGSTCAFCGVLRRNLINKLALSAGAKKVATGHNLDDETQSIVMNLFDNDMQRMSRLGPINATLRRGFVPRIKPLYECPEEEIELFAAHSGIAHYSHEKCCPFKWQAKRNFFREMLEDAEEKFPGTKFKILKSFSQIKPALAKSGKRAQVQECEKCGGPSSGAMCGTCVQLGKMK